MLVGQLSERMWTLFFVVVLFVGFAAIEAEDDEISSSTTDECSDTTETTMITETILSSISCDNIRCADGFVCFDGRCICVTDCPQCCPCEEVQHRRPTNANSGGEGVDIDADCDDCGENQEVEHQHNGGQTKCDECEGNGNIGIGRPVAEHSLPVGAFENKQPENENSESGGPDNVHLLRTVYDDNGQGAGKKGDDNGQGDDDNHQGENGNGKGEKGGFQRDKKRGEANGRHH
ncbi:hypothetical protein QR680_015657 [Steinernema hermaphroditum]|uniref:Antistasin-like domain-containing protein n=1 Tax=Steinernema hermaphroditum TaxID=289476 RepID=A0AA39HB55_9BILA|nr:hypothetical protein QR680_015657 [Steinernema hermaphroditum]